MPWVLVRLIFLVKSLPWFSICQRNKDVKLRKNLLSFVALGFFSFKNREAKAHYLQLLFLVGVLLVFAVLSVHLVYVRKRCSLSRDVFEYCLLPNKRNLPAKFRIVALIAVICSLCFWVLK